jgi:anti-sigma-K factor RskA
VQAVTSGVWSKLSCRLGSAPYESRTVADSSEPHTHAMWRVCMVFPSAVSVLLMVFITARFWSKIFTIGADSF